MRLQALASDFTQTDHTFRAVLYRYLTTLDDMQFSDKDIETPKKAKLCAMITNYMCGDEPVQDKSNGELVSIYNEYGSDIPTYVDNIVQENPELMWIMVQYLRGRINVMSALDYPDNPAEFIDSDVGQRIWVLLENYGEEVQEAIDYGLLKKRLEAFKHSLS